MLGIIGIEVHTVPISVNLSRDTEAVDVMTPKREDIEGILGRGKA